jgi:hypothetical protein
MGTQARSEGLVEKVFVGVATTIIGGLIVGWILKQLDWFHLDQLAPHIFLTASLIDPATNLFAVPERCTPAQITVTFYNVGGSTSHGLELQVTMPDQATVTGVSGVRGMQVMDPDNKLTPILEFASSWPASDHTVRVILGDLSPGFNESIDINSYYAAGNPPSSPTVTAWADDTKDIYVNWVAAKQSSPNQQ